MRHNGQRIFQWFIHYLLVVVLFSIAMLAVSFIYHPANHRELVFGWVVLALCMIPLASLAMWFARRRRNNIAEEEPVTAPTDWCLVGNIVEEHEFGESKEIRRGSKQFTPGTKVYCLPAQWGDGYERTVVVGIARGSRQWITVVMPTDLITNWRAKVVYKPAVLRRLRQGFNGFNRQWKSQQEVESWAESLRRRGVGAE